MRKSRDRSHAMENNKGEDRHLLYQALMSIAACAVVAGMWTEAMHGPALADEPAVRARGLGGGDSKRGEELYRASCVVCHGPEAGGKIGPRLSGNPLLANEPAFRKIVHEGRHVMPPLKDALSDQQIGDILAWLRTLP